MKKGRKTQKKGGATCGDRWICDYHKTEAKLERERGKDIDPKKVYNNCMTCKVGGNDPKYGFGPMAPGSKLKPGFRLERGSSIPFLPIKTSVPFASTTSIDKKGPIEVSVKRGELVRNPVGGRRHTRRRHTSRHR